MPQQRSFLPTSARGEIDGVAPLGADRLVPAEFLPAQQAPSVGRDLGDVADEAAMLAVGADTVGDHVYRLDLGTYYTLRALPSTVAANWRPVNQVGTVQTVNAKPGPDPVLNAADVGAIPNTKEEKLDGIQAEATKNAADADLRKRSTHTGTQGIGTIDGLEERLTAAAASGPAGFRRIGRSAILDPVAAVDFSLPSGYDAFRLVVSGLRPQIFNGGTIGLRFAVDGAVQGTAGDYTYGLARGNGAGASTTASTDGTEILLGDLQSPSDLVLDVFNATAPVPTGVHITATAIDADGATLRSSGGGYLRAAAVVDSLRVFHREGTVLAAGTFLLFGLPTPS